MPHITSKWLVSPPQRAPSTALAGDSGRSAEAPWLATPILIVEDESMIAWMVENILLDAGFTTIEMAATGEDAEARAASFRPGLVISDVNLGAGKDGIDSAVAIRAATRLPIIFVTAYADDAMRARIAAAVPGAALLRKPVDQTLLLRAVSSALGH